MEERRSKFRFTDVVNGVIGIIMIAFGGWAGTKLTAVSESMARLEATMRAEAKMSNQVRFDISSIEKKVDNNGNRLTVIETKLDLK